MYGAIGELASRRSPVAKATGGQCGTLANESGCAANEFHHPYRPATGSSCRQAPRTQTVDVRLNAPFPNGEGYTPPSDGGPPESGRGPVTSGVVKSG